MFMQPNNTQQLDTPKDLEFVHYFEPFTEQKWSRLHQHHFSYNYGKGERIYQ